MPDYIDIPQAQRIVVDTTGAEIVEEESPATRDSRGIYLPHYIEPVSHIAIDIGGSLAKVIYFTRSPAAPSGAAIPTAPVTDDAPSLSPTLNGTLTPEVLSLARAQAHAEAMAKGLELNGGPSNRYKGKHKSRPSSTYNHPHLRRSSLPTPLPGGLLNFTRFETSNIDALIAFLSDLISVSAKANRVSLKTMQGLVKVMATGGGAHMYYDRLRTELGVEVRREEEMECLIRGLGFVATVPEEVFWYSEELVWQVSHSAKPSLPRTLSAEELPRPSPNPPVYQVTFDPEPAPHFPCLLVNIGSGVSIVKIDEDGSFERVSGTSLGGGTLWGLLSLMTDATSFDEMLALSERGDNAPVDMLVGDIYGQDYGKIGLKSSTIASSFGKVFRKGADPERKKTFRQEDISRSLLYAISNNIGQIAYMNAEKHGLDRIYFGGCFIRGHAQTISTLSYAIRFWSKGKMRAMFLRHEGFLGAIGAWIKNVAAEDGERPQSDEEAIAIDDET